MKTQQLTLLAACVAMLSYRFNDWARAHAEVGTESSGIARGHFAALRVKRHTSLESA